MEFKQLIEKAKNEVPNPIILDMLEELEGFVGIVKEVQGMGVEVDEETMNKMGAAYDRLKTKFMRAVASYGMTLDQLEDFMGNPANFSHTDWNEMQQVKLQMMDHLNITVGNKGNKLIKNNKV